MREIDVIYDRLGRPVLCLFSNGRFVDFRGNSIGFLVRDNAYDYNGFHRGWYEDGILRDHRGNVSGFGERVGATPHSLLPLKQLKPLPALTKLEPLRPLPSLPPLKPLYRLSWSSVGPLEVFGF